MEIIHATSVSSEVEVVHMSAYWTPTAEKEAVPMIAASLMLLILDVCWDWMIYAGQALSLF